MAIYSTTRIVVRHRLSQLMHDFLLGTVSSAASGSFVCALTGWERPDDHFNKWLEVYDYSGTGAGTSGKPTNWVNSTHTLTFLPAATLTADDLVEMHRLFTVEEYNNAINLSIDEAADESLVHLVDENVVLKTNVYKYAFSTQFLWINEIRMEDNGRGVSTLDGAVAASAGALVVASGEGDLFPSSGSFPIKINDEFMLCTSRASDTLTVTRGRRGSTAAAHASGDAVAQWGLFTEQDPIDPSCWRVVHKDTIMVEFVKELWSPTNDRLLRITGLAAPSTLDTDTEATPINPMFLVQQAGAFLHQSRIQGSDEEKKYHTTQMGICQTRADLLRRRLRTGVGGAVPVVET